MCGWVVCLDGAGCRGWFGVWGVRHTWQNGHVRARAACLFPCRSVRDGGLAEYCEQLVERERCAVELRGGARPLRSSDRHADDARHHRPAEGGRRRAALPSRWRWSHGRAVAALLCRQ
eukprot:4703509-Prymnesium_polylepis.1